MIWPDEWKLLFLVGAVEIGAKPGQTHQEFKNSAHCARISALGTERGK